MSLTRLALLLALCAAAAAPLAAGPPKSKRAAAASAAEPAAAPGRTERASTCDLAALGETIEAHRSAEPVAARAQLEAIRLANGRCTRFVLALAQPGELRKFCTAPETLTAVQTARELRRRIAALEADELLAGSSAGVTCRAAYQHELKSTRVVMRSRS